MTSNKTQNNKEIRSCPIKSCPLYEYRNGHRLKDGENIIESGLE